MLAVLYAVITVLAWGTWMTPSQKIVFKNQQIKTFYVAAGNLLLSALVFIIKGEGGLTGTVFALPFIGGLVWSVSAFMAFTATDRLGMARAAGIWTPLNVVVSILWGIVIFGEFLEVGPGTQVLLFGALIILLAGVLLIINARGRDTAHHSSSDTRIGLLGALGAGVLWGSYFIPIKLSSASMWVANLPLALGIFTGSAVLAALTRQPLRLSRPGETARVITTGALWGVGNIFMLLLTEQIGAGRGFTIAQLGVVINALMGVFVLKDPAPRSHAAVLTLAGCVLASVGGILLGSLK